MPHQASDCKCSTCTAADPFTETRNLLALPRWNGPMFGIRLTMVENLRGCVWKLDTNQLIEGMGLVCALLRRSERERYTVHLTGQMQVLSDMVEQFLSLGLRVPDLLAHELACMAIYLHKYYAYEEEMFSSEGFCGTQLWEIVFHGAVLHSNETPELVALLSTPAAIAWLRAPTRDAASIMGAISMSEAAMQAFIADGRAQWIVDTAINQLVGDKAPLWRNGRVLLQALLATDGIASHDAIFGNAPLWEALGRQLMSPKSAQRVDAAAAIAFLSQTDRGCRAIVAHEIHNKIAWGFEEFLTRVKDPDERARRALKSDLPRIYMHAIDTMISLMLSPGLIGMITHCMGVLSGSAPVMTACDASDEGCGKFTYAFSLWMTRAANTTILKPGRIDGFTSNIASVAERIEKDFAECSNMLNIPSVTYVALALAIWTDGNSNVKDDIESKKIMSSVAWQGPVRAFLERVLTFGHPDAIEAAQFALSTEYFTKVAYPN